MNSDSTPAVQSTMPTQSWRPVFVDHVIETSLKQLEWRESGAPAAGRGHATIGAHGGGRCADGGVRIPQWPSIAPRRTGRGARHAVCLDASDAATDPASLHKDKDDAGGAISRCPPASRDQSALSSFASSSFTTVGVSGI
ncbi:hypothetical protein [Burkholderia sp. Bp9143]|uniref:hypothetical protein n=1 Tax=Burkholderia sp. Bp9143 TaxID=2184574 RepID=UPI000F5B580D|nr:hypothetical protein [Burkholderia sp. Bp9143]